MPRRTPRELLTPAALHILMALAQGEMHGYGVKRDVEQRTGGRLRLGPGTLYEAIHRLEADGWLEEVSSPNKDGKSKYYRLTAAGRAVMEEELLRLAEIVSFARREALMPDEARRGPAAKSVEAIAEEPEPATGGAS